MLGGESWENRLHDNQQRPLLARNGSSVAVGVSKMKFRTG